MLLKVISDENGEEEFAKFVKEVLGVMLHIF